MWRLTTWIVLVSLTWSLRAAEPETSSRKHRPVDPSWGHLAGRFRCVGMPPKPSTLQVDKDPEVCGKRPLLDESLIVNAENRGIANIVVRLSPGKDRTLPTPHKSYVATANNKVELTIAACRFVPHVTLLRTSQTLRQTSPDLILHNVKIDTTANLNRGKTVPATNEIELRLTEPEHSPVPVACSVHPWMAAWLVVSDHPYCAVTNSDGEFEIENLPVGEWTFSVWHERPGYIRKVQRDGKNEEWPKGRVTVAIRPGENRFGEIQLPAEMFPRR